MTLTPMEKRVSALLAQGFRDKEIAKETHITLRTVKYHVHNLLEKHGVDGRGRLQYILLQGETG